MNRVAIVAGARTPFVKAGKAFAKLGPLALAKHGVQGLLERHDVDPGGLDAIAFGVVVPEPGKPNLAREIVLETGLPRGIEAQTISSYCITGLRTITAIAEGIAAGRLEAGIAGGVEWLSGADPSTFREPSTGLTMGQHMELTRKEWDLPRDRQDEIALASHRNAVAAREVLAREIVPLEDVSQDSGPRDDTSLEALSGLRPVFDPEGTITAGNASPGSTRMVSPTTTRRVATRTKLPSAARRSTLSVKRFITASRAPAVRSRRRSSSQRPVSRKKTNIVSES